MIRYSQQILFRHCQDRLQTFATAMNTYEYEAEMPYAGTFLGRKLEFGKKESSTKLNKTQNGLPPIFGGRQYLWLGWHRLAGDFQIRDRHTHYFVHLAIPI